MLGQDADVSTVAKVEELSKQTVYRNPSLPGRR
jgi:hypothetical protein